MAYTMAFTVYEYLVEGDQVSGITVTVQPTVFTVSVSLGPITVGTDYSTLDGSGDPNGVVTSEFKGQIYFNTDGLGQIFISSAASSTDWIEVLRNY